MLSFLSLLKFKVILFFNLTVEGIKILYRLIRWKFWEYLKNKFKGN